MNAFRTQKKAKVDAGELSARTWADYYCACESVIDSFGRTRAVADLRPGDFAKLRESASSRLGPVSVLNLVTRVRVVFKFAFDFGLIDTPVRYGAGFDRPTKKTLRLEKAKKPAKLIPAADLWKLIGAADPQLQAMIFLGLNGGFGASDCSQLPRAALAVRPGWVEFPRQKTGVGQRFPLWPETAETLAAVVRPQPRSPELDERVFLTRLGQPWVRFQSSEAGEADHQRRDRAGVQEDGSGLRGDHPRRLRHPPPHLSHGDA